MYMPPYIKFDCISEINLTNLPKSASNPISNPSKLTYEILLLQIAHREVPQLIKMIGPEPSKFSGMSARVDEHIASINEKLAKVPMF